MHDLDGGSKWPRIAVAARGAIRREHEHAAQPLPFTENAVSHRIANARGDARQPAVARLAECFIDRRARGVEIGGDVSRRGR